MAASKPRAASSRTSSSDETPAEVAPFAPRALKAFRVRDRLDAQSVLWAITKYPEDQLPWDDREQTRAFLRYRGDLVEDDDLEKLLAEARAAGVVELLLEESSTLGVRAHAVRRSVLERWQETRSTDLGEVVFKVAR